VPTNRRWRCATRGAPDRTRDATGPQSFHQ
jgi:hypothetical protein